MFVLLFAKFALSSFRPDHAVSLGVKAPWYDSPLFDQVAYFIKDMSNKLATDFIRTILENDARMNDREFIMETAKNILPIDTIPMLEARLELKFYLPRAEMYREIARSLGGSVYASLIAVDQTETFPLPPNIQRFKRENLELESFDISFGDPETIIYADFNEKSARDIVRELINDNRNFALRPTSKTGTFGVDLRGFGIEMRPFRYSMEYGVKDVSKEKSNTQHIDHIDTTTTDFNDSIPEYISNTSAITNFDLQLASYIESRGGLTPKLIRDITNNFPLYLSDIVNTAPTATAAEAIDTYDYYRKAKTYAFLNGRRLNILDLDVFKILEAAGQERNIRQILSSDFKMDSLDVDYVCSMNQPSEASYLLHIKDVHYVNDLERDEEYADYSTDVRKLSWSTEKLPLVRKNLIDLVLVADPSSNGGLMNFDFLMYFLDIMQGARQVVFRFGITPYFRLNNPISRQVAFAYYHLRRFNETAAIEFLSISSRCRDVDTKTQTYVNVTERHFALAYKIVSAHLPVLPWERIHELYWQDTVEYQEVKKGNDYVLNLGVSANSIYLNGRRVSLSEGYAMLNYEIQRTYASIEQIVREYQFKSLDEIDVWELLSEYYMIIENIDREVMNSEPIGLGLVDEPVEIHEQYLEYMNNLEYTHADEGANCSYVLLFTNSSVDLTNFTRFMHANHSIPTSFAINPPLPKFMNRMIEFNGTNTLVVNARVYKDVDLNDLIFLNNALKWSEFFTISTLGLLQSRIQYKRTLASIYIGALLMDWTARGQSRGRLQQALFDHRNPLLYVSENTADVPIEIISNPTKREFQRMSSIIEYLDRKNLLHVKLIILPPSALTESISAFYRNALDEDKAFFTMIEEGTTYSVMPDMPWTWVTESMTASVDLDNILLKELSPATHRGEYVLTNLLVEGTIISDSVGMAGGTELALFDSSNKQTADTLSMASGYWQLPANPGVFDIKLGGFRSKTVFDFDTERLSISSFATNTRHLLLRNKPGKEGMMAYNVSYNSDTSNLSRVDVFSVASGHLYERLLKIMMVSTRRHSEHPVTFWIIKNFLSPQFKASLPLLAKTYGFDVKLVSYKWPRWLRAQYEKQRIIWGNKILFLDVLFPLSLERVIYVDADQIVRTDLVELMRMDLEGAAYAFTPFCDSRKETEPYRFWKKGYWENHLKGKKYHISALFAIDLNNFRQMAAGDYLRKYYQELSSDPGSLSNLDQDLPNYAQAHIPIYSLPQEWLWCETWCSDETMDKAKTIDLCNNPLTKRPKLEIAQTRVAEWPGLDEEVRKITASDDEYKKLYFP